MLILTLFTIIFPLWNFAPIFKNLRDNKNFYTLLIFSLLVILVFRLLDYTDLYKLPKNETYLEFTFFIFLVSFKILNKISLLLQKRDMYFLYRRSWIKCDEDKSVN